MKSCVIFRHEDFGGQLIWALPQYVTVDVQGPQEAFFKEEPQQPTAQTVGNADSAVDPSGTAQDNTNQQNDATTTGTTTVPGDLTDGGGLGGQHGGELCPRVCELS